MRSLSRHADAPGTGSSMSFLGHFHLDISLPVFIQGMESFPLTSVLCGKWKSGSMGFLGLQKPRRGQGSEFHLGADKSFVVSSLPLGSTE